MAISRIQENKDICFVCGKHIYGDRHEHHIFEGTANRKKSDEDGMVVYLHACCHKYLHDHPKSMNTIKQRGQRVWERELGNRDEFIKRYGRSYLYDSECEE